ncbi:MAG: Dna2/Cas4 domain-containing protein [Acutalibacteraceae bacterium]
MNDITVNIRNIQHYMYCARRYALLELNRDWAENAFVVNANIIHEHVHDGSHDFSNTRKTVRSNIALYNDLPQYNLYGVADCIEFVKDANGVEICGLCGKYKVCIVEYKPKAPKDGLFNETDAIQVFAQKICADFVWKCDSEAYLYYSDTRKRVRLPFDVEFDKYDSLLQNLLCEMREILSGKTIPARKKGQKCSGCSISDICFSKVKGYNVRDIVMSMKGGELL